MEEKLKNNRLKKSNGITLIALVVTIIVLIILAGISINLILGDNGIITKASQAKQENIKAQERESISLAYQSAKIELDTTGKEITAEIVEKELKKYDENVTVKEIEESEIGDLEVVVNRENATGYAEITFEKTENKYVVALKGTATEEETPTLSFTYDPPLTQYTNGTVTVTANTNTSKYTVEMSTDGTNWSSVNNLTYDANGKVFARLTDGTTELEGEVTNIDKTPPEVGTLKVYYDANVKGVYDTEKQFDENYYMYCAGNSDAGNYSFTFKVKLVNGSDSESGHKKTTYSVALDSSWDIGDKSYQGLTEDILLPYDDIQFIEENNTTVSKISSSMGDYQIIPLAFNDISYFTLIVTTEDNAGNISSRTYEIEVDNDSFE